MPDKKILLVGAGKMAIEYAKVFKSQNLKFSVVTRGEERAKVFEEKIGVRPFTGGLKNYFSHQPSQFPTHALVGVSVDALFDSCILLLENGIQNILVEKPGGKSAMEIMTLSGLARQKRVEITIAYNRRFYASVLKAQEIIKQDGGAEAFHFEFTEWGHQIGPLKKNDSIKDVWFLANSTHVADLAFFLGGTPVEMSSFTAGGNQWHPSATIFTGSGRSDSGALFTYQAHWEAPGRWGVEVLTSKHRLILRPLEQLLIQEIGSNAQLPIKIDDRLDIEYKAGLFLQVKDWMEGRRACFVDIHQQSAMMRWYYQMAGYGPF